MEKRTLLLFAAMLVLFAIYATMSLQTVPDVSSGIKAQTEMLNSLDQEGGTPAAQN